MTNHEQECLNVLDGLEDARADWIAADDELDKDRQMLAIDALLDTALNMGYGLSARLLTILLLCDTIIVLCNT